MKNPLPPVPARTDPELRAFLESVRSAVKTILERGNLNAGDLKDAGIITAEQADRRACKRQCDRKRHHDDK